MITFEAAHISPPPVPLVVSRNTTFEPLNGFRGERIEYGRTDCQAHDRKNNGRHGSKLDTTTQPPNQAGLDLRETTDLITRMLEDIVREKLSGAESLGTCEVLIKKWRMILTPASLRTELRARQIRKSIAKAKERRDNPKKEFWLKKVIVNFWLPLSSKIPFVNSIKEKHRERRAARGPFQPTPMPLEHGFAYAYATQNAPDQDPDTDRYSEESGRDSLVSDTSSVREDMFHLDGFDIVGNWREFERRMGASYN
ncbi:hypothetical protein BDFG_04393 [Blastomyces dermatitidis ATCC 26199]|nr:hypothetical protein BDFG_04393 [Blastomyces dermatitidis ATCC 26199]